MKEYYVFARVILIFFHVVLIKVNAWVTILRYSINAVAWARLSAVSIGMIASIHTRPDCMLISDELTRPMSAYNYHRSPARCCYYFWF